MSRPLPARGAGNEESSCPEGVSGARLRCIWFCLPQMCHYLSTVQITPFRSTPCRSAIGSGVFLFSIKIFSRSAPAWEPEKNIFHRGSTPLSAALSTVPSSSIVICVLIIRRFKRRSCVVRQKSKYTKAIQLFESISYQNQVKKLLTHTFNYFST
jgi:hypothetical protein